MKIGKWWFDILEGLLCEFKEIFYFVKIVGGVPDVVAEDASKIMDRHPKEVSVGAIAHTVHCGSLACDGDRGVWFGHCGCYYFIVRRWDYVNGLSGLQLYGLARQNCIDLSLLVWVWFVSVC